jgi:hypothetical protein
LLNVTQNPECLFQFFRDRIHDFAKHEFEPAIPIKDADPWLLASLLQKAIRRGDVVMARRAAHHLLKIDSQRLWRRLMTVALEDIGIASSEIAAELVAIAALPLVRRLVGGNEVAVDIAVERACTAVKDRSGDHFGSLEQQVLALWRDGLEPASMDARLAVLSASDIGWQRRLCAAVLLSDPSRESTQQRLEVFDRAKDSFVGWGVPFHLIAACETYTARARDRLPIFVPLAWSLWNADGTSRATEVHAVSELDWLDQLPAYAFDPIRTRLGRRAVDLWLRSYLQKPPFDARQIAIALWNAESAACRRTLSWPLGSTIERQARSADLFNRGLSAERHDEIAAWIAKERAALACARRAVWKDVLRDK